MSCLKNRSQWKHLKWFVWGIAGFYYLFEYIERISPVVMVDELMASFKIDTGRIGYLSAIYFYVYAIFQIPVGILADRYGPKRPLFWACLITSLGSFIFSMSPFIQMAELGRALVGLGSAFGYLCCLRLIINWFPANRFAFMCGLINMVGMIGAFLGELLLSSLMTVSTWRTIMYSMSIVGLLNVVLIGLFINDYPFKGKSKHTIKIIPLPIFKTLKKVISSPHVLLCGVFVGMIYCTFDTIAALWGIPYLQHIYHMTKFEAAETNSLIFLGAIFGYPLFGWLTHQLKHFHKRLMVISAITMLIIVMFIYTTPTHPIILRMLFFSLGFFCGVTSTATTLAKESMPIAISGTTMSIINTILVTIGGISQPLFGVFLDRSSHSDLLSSLSANNFRDAFLLMPILYGIALLSALMLKQKK